MDIEPHPRTARLRRALDLSQSEMAARLGVSQSTVDRLEKGQRETGPVSRLLDLIENELDGPISTAACNTASGGNGAAASTAGARP
ncbi:MAG TPA: helix-turn-helix transcriptional regulator [Bosea sp. (in: a-proteobacteria)]|jgi:transcriptional regulator with XRE-family HTH domain|uniref:helix-turn-helix domain-containing protein n=1 Tax=Bosea sp. (in: a-proteobacteria) TaxID=1871050 RepID=UPI002DDD25DD|nr:helix-turn-helix transcriptional regulator [Bosea sp. (in: a-proteobacteria)]HEV2552737.1 helix-turn-helix transcriptional regulator [Bosea sp. (in: a-proteobacteria)]